MASQKKMHTFEVLVSFDGLNQGERFDQAPDAWTAKHVDSGYLGDVTGEPTAAEAQGGQAPTADPARVEEASHAGDESQG